MQFLENILYSFFILSSTIKKQIHLCLWIPLVLQQFGGKCLYDVKCGIQLYNTGMWLNVIWATGTHTHTDTHTHTLTHIHTHWHTHTHTRARAHTYIHTHADTQRQTHTHWHTHTLTGSFRMETQQSKWIIITQLQFLFTSWGQVQCRDRQTQGFEKSLLLLGSYYFIFHQSS